MTASPVDEEHERDGRFYGPDVNWRRYTSDERDLAASLDQIENDDLSAHLYNTHRIKHRQRYRDSSTIRTWQSKQSWLAHGQAVFSPDRAWSAWPLESADVPRRDEKWGVSAAVEDNEYETYRRPEVWRPSVDLLDCVQAEILRQAKERFYQRKCLGARSHPIVTDSASDPRSSAMSHDEDSDASSLMSEADTQPSASTKRDGEEHTGGDTSDREASTRFSADEAVAGALVQTTVSHIMSKLDDILLGLHRSRRGHYGDRSRSRTGSPASRSTSHVARKPVEPSSPSKQKAQSPRSVMQEQVPSAPDVFPEQIDGRTPLPRDHPQRQELGTRDWSEVLGVAALVGCDQSIVARAAGRCAALFDESMTFRTMPDASAGEAREYYSQQYRNGLGAVSSSDGIKKDVLTLDANIHGHYCPHASCARHREPFLQRWRLREHLKRKHEQTDFGNYDMVGKAGQHVSPGDPSNILVDNKDQLAENLQECALLPSVETVENEEYLQPVLINIGRSKDRKVRRTPSREHLRRTSVVQDGAMGDKEIVD